MVRRERRKEEGKNNSWPFWSGQLGNFEL